MLRALQIAIAVLLPAVAMSCHRDNEPTVALGENSQTVSADDLSSGKIEIIGRLGKPIHEMMTISGTWHDPGREAVKDNSLRFRVTHVDGQELPKPVDFDAPLLRVTKHGEELAPEAGATWKFRGVETGEFRGLPQQYYAERDRSPVQTGYVGFRTEVRGFLPVPEKGLRPIAEKAAEK